jgi:hypothetical protein
VVKLKRDVFKPNDSVVAWRSHEGWIIQKEWGVGEGWMGGGKGWEIEIAEIVEIIKILKIIKIIIIIEILELVIKLLSYWG